MGRYFSRSKIARPFFRWETGIDPYAFIRVHNERRTLSVSLNSILPALHRGVIAYNDCTDGSEEIILDFCKENPGFIPARYDDFNKSSNECHAEKLARYYNFALSFIPKNEWFVKIDADQIYVADKLKKCFELPKFKNDAVILPRIQMSWDGKALSFIKERPFNFTGDHWLIFNDEHLHFVADTQNHYEVLFTANRRHYIVAEITNWHFPAKSSRTGPFRTWVFDTIPFDEFMKTFDGHPFTYSNWKEGNGKKTVVAKSMDMQMLDKSFIISYVQHFDFDS